MRSHKFLAVLGIAILFGASLVFIGCGSDDESALVIGSSNTLDTVNSGSYPVANRAEKATRHAIQKTTLRTTGSLQSSLTYLKFIRY